MMSPEEFNERAREVRLADLELAHVLEDRLAKDILAGMAMLSNSRANFRKLQALAIAWCGLRHEERPRWFA